MKIYRYEIHRDGKLEKVCRNINTIFKDNVYGEFVAVSDCGKIFVNFQWKWHLCSPLELNDCQIEKFKKFYFENYKKRLFKVFH